MMLTHGLLDVEIEPRRAGERTGALLDVSAGFRADAGVGLSAVGVAVTLTAEKIERAPIQPPGKCGLSK
jgi:hypothetical protein